MNRFVVAGFFVALVGLSGCQLHRGQKVVDGESSSEAANSNFGKALATAAVQGSNNKSISQCYGYVWKALRAVIGPKIDATSVPANSAYQFADWADRNPDELSRVFQLKKSTVYPENAPLGSVIVWNRSQCGASSLHGHIEIAIGGGKACSDYCAPIRNCSLPRVYVPSSSYTKISAGELASLGTTASCGPKMIEVCIKFNGGVASCNRKYACL